MSDDLELTRHDHVLMGLVFTLQAGAMQQMGKLQDPSTGEVRRDLDQARATIDILEMLKVKCRTSTPPDLVRLLDQAVLNLQLNYRDEIGKPGESAAQPGEGSDAAPQSADDPGTGA